MDPSSESEHLQPGTKLELHLWLARVLNGRNRRIATVELPRQYRAVQREILCADANVVDLRRFSPYYYGFGMRLLSFDHIESSDVAKAVLVVTIGFCILAIFSLSVLGLFTL